MRFLHVNLLFILCVYASASVHTVDDLVEIALSNSPDINISRLNVESTQEDIHVIDSYRLPSIDASLAAGYGETQYQDNEFNSASVFSGTITATQLIYDFGKTSSMIEGANSDINASNALLFQAISDKIFEVKNAYYELVKNRTLLRVYQENIELNKKQLYRSQRYFEAGIRTKIDITDARVRLIEAQLLLQNNQYDTKLNQITLKKILGLSSKESLGDIYEEELNITALYETLPLVKLDLNTIEQFAFTHRYELKSYAYEINATAAQLRTNTTEYYPDIYAVGEFNAQHVSSSEKYRIPERQYKVFVNAKWNLFSGFKTDADVQKAKIALMRSHSLYENAKLSIEKEVGDAYIFLLKNHDTVKLSQSLSAAAKEKHTQAQKRYEHGLSDYIELQQARQNYIDSLASLVTSYYDYYRAEAGLDRAMGK